uniref:Reverse transcriptase zinc-binding domain-containing protein n=1 Tax=Chenopodium quinoa TaxID=63459 RepID=A0A803N0U2_CHEQI
MVDSQWLSRGNIVVHRTGCYYIFACSNLADVEALLEQHTFVLDGRIGNIRRCNRYTVPANVNIYITRLWIRVYGLPLGLLDPEWAVETLKLVGVVETLEYDGDGLPTEPELRGVFLFCKKCCLVGHFSDFCHSLDYVAARRINARLEAFEDQGLTVLYNQNLRPFYTNMVEGTQDVFNNRNTRVNLLVLAQDFECNSEDSSGSDVVGDEDDNDDMDNDDDNHPNGNNHDGNDDNEHDQEHPDDDHNGDDNPDSDDGAETDNSDSDSSGAGDNSFPNGHMHDAAHTGDNNDNIDPEFIPINGVYQNGCLSHPIYVVSSSTSNSTTYDFASSKGVQSSVSSETDPTTPESYHNPSSTRFLEENRAAIPQGDLSDSEEFAMPATAAFTVNSAARSAVNAVDVHSAASLPAMLVSLHLDDHSNPPPANKVPMRPIHSHTDAHPHKRSSRGPFHRCLSYDQDPFFGYYGSTWSQKRRKIRSLNVQSKGGFTLPATDTRKAVAKSFSDASMANYLGFVAANKAQLGDTSMGCSSNLFMGLSGGKRKVEEAASASSCKSQNISDHGFASKAFCFGSSKDNILVQLQYWRQRCKKNWILKGDYPSKVLFSKVKSLQKKKYEITALLDDLGELQHGQTDVQRVLVESLKKTFKTDSLPPYDPEIDIDLRKLDLPRFNSSQLANLERPFSASEIRTAMFQIDILNEACSVMASHVLACYELPVSVTRKIDSLLMRFFLAHSDAKGMHLVNKDTMHLPRGLGVLGIRCLSSLNKALLMKQGYNWKIGNGLSTLDGSARWVNGCVPEFKPGIPLLSSAAQTVVDWFVPSSASTILAMEVPDTTQKDFRFWASTPSGSYSVKTGYAMLQQQLSLVTTPSSTNSFWKVLWSLQIKPKWKMFIWKLLHRDLVVKV